MKWLRTPLKLLRKLGGLFKRKKKAVQAWGKPLNNPTVEASQPAISKAMSIPHVPVGVKKPRKLKVPGLRTAKRGLAGLMLLVNILLALSGLAFSGLLALLFFLNVFILIDYLHKTKKIKMDWKEPDK